MKKEEIIKINNHFIKGGLCQFYMESDDYKGWFNIIDICSTDDETEAELEDIDTIIILDEEDFKKFRFFGKEVKL